MAYTLENTQNQNNWGLGNYPGQYILSTTSSNTSRTRLATPRSATPRPKDEHSQRLLDHKLEQYMKEGWCFGCGKQGYRKPDYPKLMLNLQVNVIEGKENNEDLNQWESNIGKD